MPITKATASSIAPAAKGDLVVGSATNDAAVLGVGSNDQVLTADSSTATGLKWAAPAGGAGNMVQIATGTLSGASVSITGLSTYTDIVVFIHSVQNNTANGAFRMTLNNVTTTSYLHCGFWKGGGSTDPSRQYQNLDFLQITKSNVNRTNSDNAWAIKLTNCKNPGFTDLDVYSFYVTSGNVNDLVSEKIVSYTSATISTIEMFNTGGTFSGGDYYVWGA